LKSVQLKGNIAYSAGSTQDYLRMFIVYDRQPNGALPAYGDIMEVVTKAGAATSVADSLPANKNRDRFVILKDQGFDQPPLSNVQNLNTEGYTISWFVPIKNKVSHYGSTGGNIADLTTGSLLLVTVGRNNATATFNFNGAIRVRYSDL